MARFDGLTEEGRAVLDQYKANHRQGIVDLFASNTDLPERVREHGLALRFDTEDQVLFITIERKDEAYYENIDHLLSFRIDFETGKILEIEVADFAKTFAANPAVIRFVFDLIEVAKPKVTVDVVPASQSKVDTNLRATFKELVFA